MSVIFQIPSHSWFAAEPEFTLLTNSDACTKRCSSPSRIRSSKKYKTNHMAKQHSFKPAINLVELEDSVKLLVSIPGTTKDELSVDFNKDTNKLTVSGELKFDRQNSRINEIKTGKFERVVQFNKNLRLDASNIKADYENGLLSVVIPKKEQEEEDVTMEQKKIVQEEQKNEKKEVEEKEQNPKLKVRRIPVHWEQ